MATTASASCAPRDMEPNPNLNLNRGCLQVVPTVGVEGDDGERKLRTRGLRNLKKKL